MPLTRIYALGESSQEVVRYVGKCVTSLSRRLSNHEYRARSGRDQSPKGAWIRWLQAQGRRPQIWLLEETTERWQDAERRKIAELRAQGHPLFNTHPGGNGAHSRAALPLEFQSLLGRISDARIAELAGLCRETIAYHRRRAGITPSRDYSRLRNQFRPGQTAHNKVKLPKEIIQLLGVISDQELALRVPCGRKVIQGWRKQLGILKAPRKQGDQHPNAKLTYALVRQIRGLYQRYSRENGCRGLGKRFGVDPSVIHDIVAVHIWKGTP